MTVAAVKVPEAALRVRSTQRNPRHPAAVVKEYHHHHPVPHILEAVLCKAPPPHLPHLTGLTARADSELALELLVCLLLHQEEVGTVQAEQGQEEGAEGEREVELARGQDLSPSMMMTEKS